MNSAKWETFFELLKEVVNSQGTWQDKRVETKREAKENNAENDLEEFLGWFEN